jgi:uncharacterized membrane protein YeaQ/YmgE (transglycosylase-associated protein family)
MNFAVWVLAGAALGWIGCSLFGFNEQRGKVVSMIIGGVGGVIGGMWIAPMFTATVPGDFNTTALLFAAGAAVVLLTAGNFLHDHLGI